MKRPQSASEPSAPEVQPEWAPKVLQRHGVLLRGSTIPPAQVLCTDVRGTTLLLTHLSGPQARGPTAFCQLQFSDASGILELGGALAAEDEVRMRGLPSKVLRFEADPKLTAHLNRRASYRVSLRLKGELALFDQDELAQGPRGNREDPAAQSRLQELGQFICSRKRPCIVQDISLGGARVALAAPPPRSGQTALLDIALDRGDVLHGIEGSVVQGGMGGGRDEFNTHARLRFAGMPGNAEARLARLINEVQLQTLRRGVRDRR